MRRRKLLDSERAMLRELAPGPNHAGAITQRTDRGYSTVRKILVRLEANGYIRGERIAARGISTRVVYKLTAKGRKAVKESETAGD